MKQNPFLSNQVELYLLCSSQGSILFCFCYSVDTHAYCRQQILIIHNKRKTGFVGIMSDLLLEKLCLRWNDFESNMGAAFKDIRAKEDFLDVTLACEDEQIQAHKFVLAACSPFFRNVLRHHPHQHPLLYLKGITYSNIQAVLNFMYNGEVYVAQEDLNSFLAVAEDLQVKGLTQSQSQIEPDLSSTHANHKEQFKSAEYAEQQPKPLKVPRHSAALLATSVIQPQAIKQTKSIEEDLQDYDHIKSEPRESYQPLHNMNTSGTQEHSLAAYQGEEMNQDFENYNQFEEGLYTANNEHTTIQGKGDFIKC